MRALNTPITIRSRAAGADALNQPNGGWTTDVCSVWADVLHPSGREIIAGGAESALIKASIRIHQRSDVLEGMRVYKGATAYDIQAVLPDDRGRLYMILVCQKVVA